MEVCFLGTAAGKPSTKSCTSGLGIILESSKFILIDCGEGTQTQIMKSKQFE